MATKHGVICPLLAPSTANTRRHTTRNSHWKNKAGLTCPGLCGRHHCISTQPGDFDTISQSIHTYEKAKGARINTQKSKALAIANWIDLATALGIDFQDQVTILGIKFAAKLGSTIKDNWDSVIRVIRAIIRPSAKPREAASIRATIPAIENLVFGANAPPSHQTCATNHLCVHLVHMEGRPIQSASHHPPSPKGSGRLGHDRYRG